MKIAAIVVLVFVVLALYFKTKSSDKKPKRTKKQARIAKPDKSRKTSATADKAEKNYPGIAIKLCPNACDAAKDLQKTRYLSGQAPLLPLPECDQPNCACKYVHYSDRRDINEDRRHAYSMKTELYDTTGNENRRQKKERRDSWTNFDDFGE